MNNIFVINKNADGQHDSAEVLYTILGSHSFKDQDEFPITQDANSAFAKKKILSDNKIRYFIKVGAYGRPYDPMGMYSENQGNKFLTKAGKNLFEFKEVNEKVFTYYITFLKTKNKAWLNNTEREMQ